MDLNDIFAGAGGDPLPEPNVVRRMNGDTRPWTAEQVRAIISNPCYAGIGPYPGLVDESDWIRSAVGVIEEDGAEQFLVNMLHCLRHMFADAYLEEQDQE